MEGALWAKDAAMTLPVHFVGNALEAPGDCSYGLAIPRAIKPLEETRQTGVPLAQSKGESALRRNPHNDPDVDKLLGRCTVDVSHDRKFVTSHRMILRRSAAMAGPRAGRDARKPKIL